MPPTLSEAAGGTPLLRRYAPPPLSVASGYAARVAAALRQRAPTADDYATACLRYGVLDAMPTPAGIGALYGHIADARAARRAAVALRYRSEQRCCQVCAIERYKMQDSGKHAASGSGDTFIAMMYARRDMRYATAPYAALYTLPHATRYDDAADA